MGQRVVKGWAKDLMVSSFASLLRALTDTTGLFELSYGLLVHAMILAKDPLGRPRGGRERRERFKVSVAESVLL
jgi:hypothetical protein